MRLKDALLEAQRRWGKDVAVKSFPVFYPERHRKVIYWTKPRYTLVNDRIIGEGDSWEEAFADADRAASNPQGGQKK